MNPPNQRSISNKRILILGCGWRVTRFILPALEICGVKHDNICIFRKNVKQYGQTSTFKQITNLDSYTDCPDMVLNCLPSNFLFSYGNNVINKFPDAKHYWDTASEAKFYQILFQLFKNNKNIVSLEDFPYLFNITALVKISPNNLVINTYFFGIPVHFLSLVRNLNRKFNNKIFFVIRSKLDKIQTSIGHTMSTTKNYKKSFIEVKTEGSILKDEFIMLPEDVYSNVQSKKDLLYRVYNDTSVSYLVNNVKLITLCLPFSFINNYFKKFDKRDVHEFDKVLSLTYLFTSTCEKYTYDLSIRDLLGSKFLNCFRFCYIR